MDLHAYWSAALAQDAEVMRKFFHKNACVRWPNTNERFTVEEFLRANCEYPGAWAGTIERIVESGDLIITVTHVCSADQSLSFHVTSFFQLEKDQIVTLDEYWGDDGPPPQWRQDLRIGRPIV